MGGIFLVPRLSTVTFSVRGKICAHLLPSAKCPLINSFGQVAKRTGHSGEPCLYCPALPDFLARKTFFVSLLLVKRKSEGRAVPVIANLQLYFDFSHIEQKSDQHYELA